MQLTMFERDEPSLNASSAGRTSQESYRTKAMRSAVSSQPWWANPMRSSRQGEDGRTLVVCMAPADQSLGGFWMPNISAWPNDAVVCSLSQVLEQGSIPHRYCLSAKACAGIIRRAEARGKTLPPALSEVLTAVATLTTPEQDTCSQSLHTGGRTSGPVDVAACLVAKGHKCDFEVETFCVHGTQDPCVSTETAFALGRNNGGENAVFAIQAGALRTNPASGPDGVGVQEGHAYTLEARAEVQAVCVTGDITHTLKADGFDGFDGSEDGTGRGQPIVTCDVVGTMSACGATAKKHGFGWGQQDWESGYCQPHSSAVRRLTPTECERLQGFPDNYTLIPWRGKPADECPDGPRYKAIGNSKAVPVVRWIGRRIKQQLEQQA